MGSCVQKQGGQVGSLLGLRVFSEVLLQTVKQQKEGCWSPGLMGRAQELKKVMG